MRQRAAVAAISLLLGLAAVSPALAKGDHSAKKAGSAQASPQADDEKPDKDSTTTTVDPDDTDTTDGTDGTGADGDDPTDTTDTTDGTDTTDTSMPDDDDSASMDDSTSSTTATTAGTGSTGTTATTSSSSAGGSTATTATTATTGTTATTMPPTTATTGTTVTTMAKNTCEAPQVTREPAPEAGQKKNYLAGSAGDVDVERVNSGELRIASFTAADGWVAEVSEPSGSRVAVKFKSTADPKNIVKFNAALNTDGTQIVIRVLNCRSNEADPEPATAPEDDDKSATKP